MHPAAIAAFAGYAAAHGAGASHLYGPEVVDDPEFGLGHNLYWTVVGGTTTGAGWAAWTDEEEGIAYVETDTNVATDSMESLEAGASYLCEVDISDFEPDSNPDLAKLQVQLGGGTAVDLPQAVGTWQVIAVAGATQKLRLVDPSGFLTCTVNRFSVRKQLG
ncbi:MAG TPA: hypothetical protein VFW19_13940 [Allosphingosinicella sp.]|nr:hypothetical protein [Allosphingosinicella sp.]